MPPKSKIKVEKSSSKPKKAGSKGMAQPLTPGLVLTDLIKNTWELGPKIGQGGFGYIYTGVQLQSKNVSFDSKSEFVIKVEPHANGPLYGEITFYQRVAKIELIDEWLKSKKKLFVGIPRYIATGSFDGDVKYRFLVVERFGTDIERVFKQCNMKFPEKTVYSLGLRVIDALEYIHSKEYVHADIKSSNLMLGFKKMNESKIYLLDYGLAYRYAPDGKHVPYKEDPKRRHDGTIEYTSRDAHRGCAPSRKGDLEILGYCMVQWLCSRLPWEDNLKDKNFVMEEKIKYMSDIPYFMKKSFPPPHKTPVHLQSYLKIIANMKYDEQPDYQKIKNLFVLALKSLGIEDDGVSIQLPLVPSPQKKRPSMNVDKSPNKKKRISNDSPNQFVNLKPLRPALNKVEAAQLTTSPPSPLKQVEVSPSKYSPLSKNSSQLVTSTQHLTTSLKETRNTRKKELTNFNGTTKTVHVRKRKRNISTRDFGQSP